MGTPRKPIPPAKRKRIADAIRAGDSLGKVAKEYGVSKGTVHNIAKENELSVDRSMTKEATAVAMVDHAARRAALAEAQLALAEAATQRAAVMMEATSAREASLIAAISIDKYAKLDRYDSDTQNLSAFDDFISTIVGTTIAEAS